MVYRIYVEKKPGLDHEARALCADLTGLLSIQGLTGIRLLNRYDVENVDEALFRSCSTTVFSELPEGGIVFAVEPLPGQFDQRADSAAQCIQIISCGDRPTVRTAKVYILEGTLSEEDVARIKKYVINPVECREASLETVETLQSEYAIPETVKTVEGFIHMDDAALSALLDTLGLAMDIDDLKFLQNYFAGEE